MIESWGNSLPSETVSSQIYSDLSYRRWEECSQTWHFLQICDVHSDLYHTGTFTIHSLCAFDHDVIGTVCNHLSYCAWCSLLGYYNPMIQQTHGTCNHRHVIGPHWDFDMCKWHISTKSPRWIRNASCSSQEGSQRGREKSLQIGLEASADQSRSVTVGVSWAQTWSKAVRIENTGKVSWHHTVALFEWSAVKASFWTHKTPPLFNFLEVLA